MPSVEAWRYADGQLDLRGEMYRPDEGANGRAVLVVHEADGIGGNVRRHCELLCREGYIAAAADLHGQGRPLRDEEIAPALAILREPALLRRRVGAAFEALARDCAVSTSAIAAIGYCFGGTAVLELARSGAPLAAVASFHGLLTTSKPAAPGAIKARVLACTGALDPLVPLHDITAFQKEMTDAGADWQLAVYGRAKHSFTNRDVDALGDERMAFDAEAEDSSWALLIRFLEASFNAPGGCSFANLHC